MRIQIPIQTPPEENIENMTVRSTTSANGDRDGRGSDTSSIVHVDHHDIMSNADLYNTMTPPAYTQSVAASEIALEAEDYQQEKIGLPAAPYTDAPDSPATLRATTPPIPGPSTRAPTYASQAPNDHFTEHAKDEALAYVRRCTVLPDRPAVWLVKRKNFALSSLAAAVLCKEGLLRDKDLVLISQNSGAKRDPTDPLSAVAFATYDTVGDMMSGLIAGPMEVSRQVTPMLVKYEQRQSGLQIPNVRHSVLQESSLAMQHTGTAKPTPDGATSPLQLRPEDDGGWSQPNVWSDAPPSQRRNSTLEAAPNAAKQVAIGTGKGLGRIVGAGLKAPMTFTHGMARGFHNVPKLYGEEVREYENITDLRSGLSVSAKGFGHGLSDGLKDFFVKPIEGAQKEGAKGLAKGFGKGVGNLVCKPTSGAIGLVGYSFVGVYKGLQGINFTGKDSVGDVVRYQGEAEYEQASKELRLDVVNRWCQVMMRQKV